MECISERGVESFAETQFNIEILIIPFFLLFLFKV